MMRVVKYLNKFPICTVIILNARIIDLEVVNRSCALQGPRAITGQMASEPWCDQRVPLACGAQQQLANSTSSEAALKIHVADHD